MARYGCTITVAAGKIPSSQSNFSWLATEANFPTAAIDGGAQSILNGGGNLRCYTDSTKATQIPVEVVAFVTGGTPSIQVWGLSSTLAVASTVYIEADTVATSQPIVTDTYGRNSVWADHELVIHQGTIIDSTGNHTPALVGTPSLLDMMWGGQGYDLGSTGQYITVPHTASLNIEKNYTTNAWVKYTLAGGNARAVITKTNASNTDGFLSLVVSDTSRSRHPDLTVANLDFGSTLADNTIYRLGSDMDGTTRKTLVDTSYTSDTPTGTVTTVTDDLRIGSSPSGSTLGLDDILGDVWIKKSSVTDDRRTGEQNNQDDPTTFWTTSTWVDQGAGGGSTLVADSGGYTYTGTSVATLKASIFKTDSGSYSYNGNVAGLLKGSLLSTDTSNYAYTGTSTTLTYTPAGTNLLAADTGNYSYSGGDITFSRNRVIITSSGNYTYSGSGVSIILPGQIWTDRPAVNTTYTNKPAATTNWTDK